MAGGGGPLLTFFQGAVLLTADCLGTGLLALPSDVNSVLGLFWGIVVLVLQLPLNLYAGTVLHQAAALVEARGMEDEDVEVVLTTTAIKTTSSSNKTSKGYDTINIIQQEDIPDPTTANDHLTFDFIGMTNALFDSSVATSVVMVIYYTNIFLVLGDYILVMSHAFVAMVGGNLCLPTAGLLASTLMYGVAQLRTMATLGRTAAFVSLGALLLVLLQCLVALETITDIPPPPQPTIWSKFSGLAAIGFAVGSQKLFLNIRHEMRHREESPKALCCSLSFYVSAYIVMCIIAGPSK